MDVAEFDIIFVSIYFLAKTLREQRNVFLTGVFNINALNCKARKPVNDFMDSLTLSSFVPTYSSYLYFLNALKL